MSKKTKMELNGSLQEFGLSDIVQFLGSSRKTGRLDMIEWVVLSKIGGDRSVKELAEAASISEYHTCRLRYPLIVNRLIRLREPVR